MKRLPRTQCREMHRRPGPRQGKSSWPLGQYCSVDEPAERKRRRVRRLQRYIVNPPTKLIAWAGLLPGHVVIETKGRLSGKQRRNIVGMLVDGNTGWVVAEQGRHAAYVLNLEADPQVRVRIGRHWRPARAQTMDDDDPQARLDAFGRRGHAAAVRRFGTELMTVRFDLAPPDQSF